MSAFNSLGPGVYTWLHAGGSFPVALRPNGVFHCPAFPALASWEDDQSRRMVDWKQYGKYDENRAKANGYQPMQAQAGKYQFIPGFVEGLNAMSFGDKATIFIPSKLGYGERGAGGVIPPNANIIFEVELLEGPGTPAKPVAPETSEK